MESCIQESEAEKQETKTDSNPLKTDTEDTEGDAINADQYAEDTKGEVDEDTKSDNKNADTEDTKGDVEEEQNSLVSSLEVGNSQQSSSHSQYKIIHVFENLAWSFHNN